MATNLERFDASSMMREISKYAPTALLVFALLSFISISIFSIDYYEELFKSRFEGSAKAMAILVSVIQEAVRFGLLIASVRDFTNGKKTNGFLGILASIGLVIHDINLSDKIAAMWALKTPDISADAYSSIFVFLIVIGLVLELRLILTVNGKKSQSANTNLN